MIQTVPVDIQGAVLPSPELAQPQPALRTVTAAPDGQAAAGVTEQDARQDVQPQPALPTDTAAANGQAAAGVKEQQARGNVQPQPALPTVTAAAGVTGPGLEQTAQQMEALPHLGKRTAQDADLQVS